MFKSIISLITPFKSVTKPLVKSTRGEHYKTPQWGEVKKTNIALFQYEHVHGKIRGFFDAVDNLVIMDNNKVIQLPGRYIQNISHVQLQLEIQKWARYRKLIQGDEIIAIGSLNRLKGVDL